MNKQCNGEMIKLSAMLSEAENVRLRCRLTYFQVRL